MACSSYNRILVENEQIKVDVASTANSHIDSLILPYRSELEKEMNQVVAIADRNLLVERPCGVLNNWVADAVLSSQLKNGTFDAPVICLLNTGGIRSSINKGNVLLGDLFKVMPFDNFVVCAKMPVSSIPEIEKYLKVTGGEPIAGAKLEKGKLIIPGMDEKSAFFWIVSSDYLVNGGDKMTFFEQKISSKAINTLMRDILITEAKSQGILLCDTTNRITF